MLVCVNFTMQANSGVLKSTVLGRLSVPPSGSH